MSDDVRELWLSVAWRTTPARLASLFSPAFSDDEGDDENDDALHADGLPDWQPDGVSGQNVVLIYVDSRGSRSERHVRCRKLAQSAEAMHLSAWCELRQQLRSFRVDRIVEVFDAVSGESLGDGTHWARGFVADSGNTSGYRFGLTPRDFADLNAALNVLAFVSRCDHEQHPAEMEAAMGFVCAWWLRRDFRHDLDETALWNWVTSLAPDAETFFTSLRRSIQNPLIAPLLRRWLAQVIVADDVIHERETFWGGKIDALFSAVSR